MSKLLTNKMTRLYLFSIPVDYCLAIVLADSVLV